MVRPRAPRPRPPQRSCSVRRSATAWHGCSSLVSALITCSRGAASANSIDAILPEGADHGARHPAFEVAGDVGDGLARAERAFLRRHDHVAAELVHGDLERRARPQRRLVEQQRDVLAGQRLRRRRAASELALALQPRGELAAGARSRRRRSRAPTGSSSGRRGRGRAAPRRRAWRAARNGRTVEDRAELFTAIVTASRQGLRAVLGVDLHVLGREVAGPHRGVLAAVGAEIDRDADVLALQVGGGLRGAFVERPARARTARCRRSSRARRPA